MGHDVFISHAAENKVVADAVLEKLEENGIGCWIAPRDIRPGDSWGGAIVRAIESSKILILIFSSKSNRSHQVLREVERAVQKNVVLLPFRIEDITPTVDMEYFLSTTQWLDALSSNLDEHIETLAETIKLIIDHRDPDLDVAEVIAQQNDETVVDDANDKVVSESPKVPPSLASEDTSHKQNDVTSAPDLLDAVDEREKVADEVPPPVMDEPESSVVASNDAPVNEKEVVEPDELGAVDEKAAVEPDAVDGAATDVMASDVKAGESRQEQLEELFTDLSSTAESETHTGRDTPVAETPQDDQAEPEDLPELLNAGRAASRSETEQSSVSAELVVDRAKKQQRAVPEQKSNVKPGLWAAGLLLLIGGGGFTYYVSKAPSTPTQASVSEAAKPDVPKANSQDVDKSESKTGDISSEDGAADVALDEESSAAVAETDTQTESPPAVDEKLLEEQRQAQLAKEEAQRQLELLQARVVELKQQADQGSADAAFELADLYAGGEGLDKDLEESAVWLQKAAELGLDQAQYRLALAFKNGTGVPQNPQSAVALMTQAAEQGNIKALNELGLWYEKAEGVEQNYEMAFKLYSQAAEQGDPSGQRSLGIFYEFGLGVNQDYQQALEWYRSAAEKGDPKADLFRQDLESRLADQQSGGG